MKRKTVIARLLAICLALVLVFGLVPAQVFAANEAEYADFGAYDTGENAYIETDTAGIDTLPEPIASIPLSGDADDAVTVLNAHSFTPVVQPWVTNAATSRTAAIDQVRAYVNTLLAGLDVTVAIPAPGTGVSDFPNPLLNFGAPPTDRTFTVNLVGDDGTNASTTIVVNIAFPAPSPGPEVAAAVTALAGHAFAPVDQAWIAANTAAQNRTAGLNAVIDQINAAFATASVTGVTAVLPATINELPTLTGAGLPAADRSLTVNLTGPTGTFGSARITVNMAFQAAPATGITITTAPLTGRTVVIADSTLQFNAAVLPAGVPQGVTWGVSGHGNATIDATTGLLTVGDVPASTALTITATTTAVMGADGLPVSNTATVTVVPSMTVYVSAEAFTIGEGFVVEPTRVRMPAEGAVANRNAMLALHIALEGTPYSAFGTGTTPATTGLTRLGGFVTGPITPPPFMVGPMDTTAGSFNVNAYNPAGLGNGDFGSMMAGWMFTVNDVFPGIDPETGIGWGTMANQATLNEGDVIRWQFSLLGASDIGMHMSGFAPPFYRSADTSSLVRALLDTGNAPIDPAARTFALNAIINPMASSALIASATAWIVVDTAPSLTPVPDAVALNRTAWNNATRGQSQTFAAQVFDQFGNLYTDQNVTWSLVPAPTGTTLSGGPAAEVHANTTFATGVVTISAEQMGGAMVLTAASAADPTVRSANASVATARPGISLLAAGQPVDVTVTKGSITGNLTVTASATGTNLTATPLTFQWFSNTTASNTGGTAIDGATNASFAIPTGLAAGTHYFYVAVSTALGTVPVNSRAVTVTVVEPTITVYMSFEGFNLGHGFYIYPTQMQIPVGSSIMGVTSILLGDLNHTYDTAWGGLDRVHGIHPGGAPNPPGYITITLDTGPTDGSLGSGDYSFAGGWMNTVNHATPQIGASDFILLDGDVIRWQFSVEGWGGDLGMPDHWEPPLFDHADKTLLIRALFAPGIAASEIPNARNAIINPLATQTEVDAALADLLDGASIPVHKAGLVAAIVQANARQEQNYTAASWATMVSARTAAIAVADNVNATQAQVNAARNALVAAIDGLRTVPVELLEAKHGALGWLRGNHVPPGLDSEWAVLALARAGIADQAWYDEYLANLEAALAAGSTTLSALDFARITLAVTALGEDATSFGSGGQDLTSTFSAFTSFPTVNAHIFALIALDSAAYPGTGAQHLDAILAAQDIHGGWGLTAASTPTVDMTAMALQALAPHQGIPVVDTAISDALAWLDQQAILDAHGYAQVIVALAALGIDAEDYVDGLMGFFDPVSGGFRQAGIVNAITTEQAAYALGAYWRFLEGMDSLYNMNNDAGPPWTGVIAANRAALNSEIARAQAQIQANFTGASWTVMQDALTAAIAVRDNTGATQAQVDTARSVLLAAVDALVPSGGGTGPGGGLPQQNRASISVIDPNAGSGQTSVFFANQSFDLNPNETVYSLLQRTGLTIVATGPASNRYVRSINGWGEFSDGPESGWMFRVNGVFPDQSPAQHVLQNGDRVEWLFTRDMGADLGGGPEGPGQRPPAGPGEDEDDEWENPFDDVVYGRWYHNYVRFVSENELMVGTAPGQFSPQTSLSRAMVVTILWRLADEPTASGGNAFHDVGSERWYTEAIVWASANRIVQGFGDGRFGPADDVTREQMAVILRNFAAYQELDVTGGTFTAEFYDIALISPWALAALEWANANGIINGHPTNTIAPGGSATRAESAAMLYRFIENVLGGM